MKALLPQNLNSVKRTYGAFAVFVILILVFYANTLLERDFILDDRWLIENNPSIQSLKHLPRVITGCIWEAHLVGGCSSTGIHYRPIYTLSHLVTWQISSTPQFFHFVSLLYFLAAAFLAFLLVKLLTRNFVIAFLTGIFFIIHPVNNEVANWIAPISESTFAIFTLLAVMYHVKHRRESAGISLFLVYLFYFFAMLSKEPAVFVIPLAILLLDLVIFQMPVRRLLRSQEMKKYALFAIPLAVYFSMRIAALGLGGAFLMSGGHIKGFSLTERIYAFFTLFIQYLKELLFPYPLRFFHDFSLRSDLLNPPFLLSFIGVAVFFLLVSVSIKRHKHIAAFSLLWIALFFLPVLVAFDTAEIQVFFDRFFFVPSIGFAFLLSYALVSLWHSERTGRFFGTRQRARIAVVSFVSILIVVSWLTVTPRNKVWKDTITFYAATLQEKSDAHFMRRELADIYLQQGELEQAKQEFEHLIQQAPDWKDITMAYKGLGDYYRARGEEDMALQNYLKAADTSSNAPRDYVVYNDIGALYMNNGEYLKGFGAFCQSLGLFSASEVAQVNFNDALNVIDEKYIQQGILHKKILEEFNKSPDEKIVYRDKRCEEKTCQYAFSFQAQQFEVLPPFLITAVTSSGQELEIANKGFNPQTGVIVLELDSKHKDQTLTFLFPACQGIYYEAVANPQ